MRIKNYYKILDLSHNATQHEIKKAYRQLALKYHPDKNAGNQFAESHFREIQEAYQILSDPKRRSAYTQQRWYHSSTRKYATEHLTPQIILSKCQELSRYLSISGSFHINRQILYKYIMHLLSETSIELLLEWNEPSKNSHIITELLKAGKPLPYKDYEKICQRLRRLAGTESSSLEVIQKNVKERRMLSYWQTYQGLVMLIITLILCWFVYIISI